MAPDDQPHDSPSKNAVLSRRRFLAGSSGLGAVALAGCTGGGGDGGGATPTPSDGGSGQRVSMLTTPPGTLGNALGNGLMTMVSQNTDLTGSASAGTGSIQNIVTVMRGQADFATGVTSILVDAYNRRDPVDVDAQYDPLQLCSFYYLNLATVCRMGSDYQYVSDLDGEPFAVGPQPASFQPVLETAFESVMDSYNPAFSAPNQMGPQLAGRNVEAAIFMDIMGTTPSFSEQIAARNDLRMLGWRDENMQAIRDNPDVPSNMVPNERFGDAIDEFVMSPETFVVRTNYSLISSMATSADTVYTVLDTVFNNRDSLPDIHAGFGPWTEASFWTALVDDRLPFHPGAERFLKENDLWEDSFTAADG